MASISTPIHTPSAGAAAQYGSGHGGCHGRLAGGIPCWNHTRTCHSAHVPLHCQRHPRCCLSGVWKHACILQQGLMTFLFKRPGPTQQAMLRRVVHAPAYMGVRRWQDGQAQTLTRICMPLHIIHAATPSNNLNQWRLLSLVCVHCILYTVHQA